MFCFYTGQILFLCLVITAYLPTYCFSIKVYVADIYSVSCSSLICQFVKGQMNPIQTKRHMLLLQIRGIFLFTDWRNRPHVDIKASQTQHCISVCLPGHWLQKKTSEYRKKLRHESETFFDFVFFKLYCFLDALQCPALTVSFGYVALWVSLLFQTW